MEFLLNRLCPSSASVSPGLIPWAVPSTKPTPMVDHELDYILDTEEDMHGSTEKDEDEGDFDKEDEDESFLDHSTVARLAKRRKCYPLTSLTALQHPGSKFKDCRGAVLADEMGLGKSLVSIAVLWHFVKHGENVSPRLEHVSGKSIPFSLSPLSVVLCRESQGCHCVSLFTGGQLAQGTQEMAWSTSQCHPGSRRCPG